MSAELAVERLQGVRAVVSQFGWAVSELRGSSRLWTAKTGQLIGELEDCWWQLSALVGESDATEALRRG